MKKTFALLIFSQLLSITLFGQIKNQVIKQPSNGATLALPQTPHRTCAAMDELQEQLAADPSLLQRQNAIEQQTAAYIAHHAQSAERSVITIPVVFHIIHDGDAVGTNENIADAYIMAQLDQLNDDFRKLNSDIGNVPGVFSGIAADTEIEFCLAQRDPSGNATTGINRYNMGQASWARTDINGTIKPTTIWNRNQYLNVWTLVFGGADAGLLGYGQFPGGTANTDGVVLLYNSVGSIATPFPGGSPYDKGRTGTHEVGHWLNLRHIWGDDTGDPDECLGDDLVGDTPNQQIEHSGCPSFPQVTCSNGPNGDMFMNYMDYVNDACMNMFSAGQKARMQALFAPGGARASLATSLGCYAPYTCEACGAKQTDADITACVGGAALNFTPTTVNSTATTVLAAPTGSLAATDPTFNRPTASLTGLSNGATNVYYDVFTFQVSVTGSYTFAGTFAGDGFGILYQNSFNPASPISNAVIANDDTNPPNDPLITTNLTTGITYYLVTTSYNNGETGAYSWIVTPPSGGQLQLTTGCDLPATGYNYTYFITNSSGNIIAQTNAPVNMTGTSAGTYTVCGFSYPSTGFTMPATDGTVNLTTWAATLNGIAAATCGSVSSDCITVTINSGCCPTLNVGATGSAGAVCSGASVSTLLATAAGTITLTGGTIPTDATIAWFDDAAFTTPATTNPTNTTCSALPSKTYYAQATCVSNTATTFPAGSVTITVYPAPAGFTVNPVAGSCGVAAKAELICGGSVIGTAESGTAPSCAAPSQSFSGAWTAAEIAAAIGNGATASCYSDISYGPIAAACTLTPTATVTTSGNVCVIGTGTSTLDLSTLVTAGNTGGTWSLVTANGTSLAGSTLSAGTAVDAATAAVSYTITGTDCADQTYDATITVNDCTVAVPTFSVSISDPCQCHAPGASVLVVAADGTVTDLNGVGTGNSDGLFDEVITATYDADNGTAGVQYDANVDFRVVSVGPSVAGGAAPAGIANGDILTDNLNGTYEISFEHTSGVGYTATIEAFYVADPDGAGPLVAGSAVAGSSQVLTPTPCVYPEVVFSAMPTTLTNCAGTTLDLLTLTNPDTDLTFGGGAYVSGTTFNAVTAGVGTHTVTVDIDPVDATPPASQDGDCLQPYTLSIGVTACPPGCAASPNMQWID